MKIATREVSLPKRQSYKRASAVAACAVLLAILAMSAARITHAGSVAADRSIRFRIGLAPGLTTTPVAGRMLIFMTQSKEAKKVIEPDFLDPKSVWITGCEVRNLTAGKTVEVDPDALAYPAPFSKAPEGDYQIMALLDVDHSMNYSGIGPGDLRSKVVAAGHLNPLEAAPIELTLNERIPDKAAPVDTENVKLVTFNSAALGAFWGRSIEMRAGVVLPPSYARSPGARYPTAYFVHGFGGSHLAAWREGPKLLKQMTDGTKPEMISVFLDGSCPMGHHEFADSANNGPWGRALTTEFIPYLESKFRMDGRPQGRLLSGHSSGGWSTLWLQITYPDIFGGTWSTSPDPVDFHNFTGPDLTRSPPQSFYGRTDGTPYNLVRFRGRELMTVEDFARFEQVMGDYGGQMASFEAVFSPKGDDGRPMALFDRETGRIDPFVQKAWERYDIARIVRGHWKTLGPKLGGKLHIVVGTADNFHLNEAVALLRDVMKELGSDASFEFIEGRDHMDLYEGGLDVRIAQEMYKVARPAAK